MSREGGVLTSPYPELMVEHSKLLGISKRRDEKEPVLFRLEKFQDVSREFHMLSTHQLCLKVLIKFEQYMAICYVLPFSNSHV